MASIRLTNTMRERILRDIMIYRFDEEEKKLQADEYALGQEIYRHCLGKKGLELINSLPPGWVPTTNNISVRFAGSYTHLNTGENLRCPAENKHRCWEVFDAGHKYTEQFNDFRNREKDLKERKEAVRVQIKAALESATTAKRLKELWPEIASFIECHAKEPAALPMPILNKLNKELNLPPEEEKNART